MSKVSVIKTKDYSLSEAMQALDSHFALLGLSEGLTPHSRVLIKPNLITNKKPDDAATTNPVLISALIDKLREYGVSDITIADSPGGPFNHAWLKRVYTATGMEQLAQEKGVKLGYNVSFTTVENPHGKICRSFEIIPAVTEADFIINICKLKSHSMTLMSAAVKNLFGCVPGLLKPELHFRYPEKPAFGRMLVDLSLLVKPRFTIVDAVETMEGDGPTGGEKRYVGLTLASKQIYDLDLALCTLIGFEPQQVPTIADAVERGLCSSDFTQLELVGDKDAFSPIKDFKRPRSRSVDFIKKIPAPIRKPFELIGEKIISPKPAIIKSKCIGCGRCAESCPPKTINMISNKAVIDYSRCIKCYCCQEMCPVKAIDIKRLGLLRF